MLDSFVLLLASVIVVGMLIFVGRLVMLACSSFVMSFEFSNSAGADSIGFFIPNPPSLGGRESKERSSSST